MLPGWGGGAFCAGVSFGIVYGVGELLCFAFPLKFKTGAEVGGFVIYAGAVFPVADEGRFAGGKLDADLVGTPGDHVDLGAGHGNIVLLEGSGEGIGQLRFLCGSFGGGCDEGFVGALVE